MKAITLLATSMLIASAGVVSNTSVDDVKGTEATQDTLLSCLWITYCGDPDVYSPILQPKRPTTDTQDAKDDKLA